jgi:hypothetical protein
MKLVGSQMKLTWQRLTCMPGQEWDQLGHERERELPDAKVLADGVKMLPGMVAVVD